MPHEVNPGKQMSTKVEKVEEIRPQKGDKVFRHGGYIDVSPPDKNEFFCVVAENRITKKREMLTSPMTREKAEAEARNPGRSAKITHKYFRVAKFPYKDKKAK